LDIYNVFLHDILNEELYIHQPQDFIHQNSPNHVCCLKKAYMVFVKLLELVSLTLLNLYNFMVFRVPRWILTLCDDDQHLLVLIYVDDIIITGSNYSVIA